MATDYGGTHGGQPRRDGQPRYPSQPPDRGVPYAGPPAGRPPPYGGPPPPGPAYGGPPQWTPPPERGRLSRRRAHVLALAALVLGAIGLVSFGAGVWLQVAPRKFTARQQRQITDWELGKRWRDLTAGTIFPASAGYPAPLDGDPALSARRVGVARQASCSAATDSAAAAVLDRYGCAAILRATYVDATDSYAVTIGAAVLPDSARAAAATHAIDAANGARSAVHAVPVAGTPAAAFTDKRRQLSGEISAGSYVVLYTVGYADSRPKEPVSGNSYTDAEMKSAGAGIAHDVLSALAAPVPSPGCPGTPGC
ncbi:MAG: hypothetical protein ACRDNS_03245 [Trebonia sp.]